MENRVLNINVYKLTITVVDHFADIEIDDMSPLSSAVSNLEYDGYTVLNQDMVNITWEEAMGEVN